MPLRSSDSNLTRRDRWNQKTGFTFRGAARGPYKKKAPWVPVIPPDDLLGSPLFSMELELRQAELAGGEVKHGDEMGGGAVTTRLAFGRAEDAV